MRKLAFAFCGIALVLVSSLAFRHVEAEPKPTLVERQLFGGHVLAACVTAVRMVVSRDSMSDTLTGIAVIPCPSWQRPDSIINRLAR